MTDNLNRYARFETLEPRRVMSAQALNDFVADFQIEASEIDIDQQIQIVTQSANGQPADHSLEAIRQQYNLDGTGQTIAVIDSGIAFDHIALGAGFGFGHKVVGGYDFAENDANPYDDGPVGLHGTHVAGIIGGQSDEFKGVAPGADLVSLRVFDDHGNGELAWVEQALRWVHENRTAFENPITTVNLSLGTNWNANTVPDAAQLEDEFAQLEADGIFISVAAGNLFANYHQTGVSYPAASPFVIPVASHNAAGNLSDFSQRNEHVLVAPGENILSTVPDHLFAGSRESGYLRSSGTSQAAPYVAGASALLRDAFLESGVNNIDQDLLYERFRETADIIYDQVTGSDYHRINLARAIESILGTGADNNGPLPTAPVSVENGLLVVNGTSGNDQINFHFGAVLDVDLNGTTYQINNNLVNRILVIGGAGTDAITASFGHDVDKAILQVGRVDVYGPQIAFTARGFETIDLDGGTSADQLIVWDSVGNDSFTADFNSITIDGHGHANSATSFSRVRLRASDGFDIVQLAGSAGDDRFIANDGRNVLRNEFNRISATGFEATSVTASGGQDYAHLFDSAGNDRFELSGNGFHLDSGAYQIWGGGFERINAYSSSGFDSVVMHGSNAADNFVHRTDHSRLQSGSYLNVAHGFEQISVWAQEGTDTARIHDSAGFDVFNAAGNQTRLQSVSQTLVTDGFELVDVRAIHGGLDSATLTGTAANDFVAGTASTVSLENAIGVEVTVRNFDQVTVNTLGGYDTSSLRGGIGNDHLRSLGSTLEFESTLQMLRIVNAENHLFNGGGGINEVVLEDFDHLDLLAAIGNQATAWLNSQRIEVFNFDFLEARVRSGQTGFYEIDAVDYLYLLDGDWQQNQA